MNMTNETIVSDTDPFASIKADLQELRDDSMQTGLSIMSDFEVAGQFFDRNPGGEPRYDSVPDGFDKLPEEYRTAYTGGQPVITLFKFTGA